VLREIAYLFILSPGGQGIKSRTGIFPPRPACGGSTAGNLRVATEFPLHGSDMMRNLMIFLDLLPVIPGEFQ